MTDSGAFGLSGDGTVARAFELARTGDCKTVQEIRLRLKQEGYSNIMGHLEGPSIKRQLAALMKGAR